MTTSLDDLVLHLSGELRLAEIPDYPGAVNGLQLANGGSVNQIAVAVDACLPVIREAVLRQAYLLIVHH